MIIACRAIEIIIKVKEPARKLAREAARELARPIGIRKHEFIK